MAELVSPQDFAKATHLQRFDFAVKALMNFSKITALNQLYAKADQKEGVDFIDEIFRQLDLYYDVNPSELERIPKNGPFICLANHPYGAIDGLLMIYLFQKVRPDFKVLANFLLTEIKPLKDHFIPINPFGEKVHAKPNQNGIRSAIKLLEEGGCLGIFPSGEVSTFQFSHGRVADKRWGKSILKFIRNSNVPVIPMHFSGKNSLLFHLLGFIHPSLRTASLPSELMNKKKAVIRVRIGKPITVNDQQEWSDAKQLGRFLRAKVYAMESELKVNHFFRKKINTKKQVAQEVVEAQDVKALKKEIESISDLVLFSQANFTLYFATADRIPMLLNEIGRLREVTFRAVGEGSNKSIDLDEYDLHYQHLFLWDHTKHSVVGAYRLGDGKTLLQLFGKSGFYIHSLFKIKNAFLPYLDQSIELGRSFIVKEYQQKRLPLFLLWKGILHQIKSTPQARYLIGPVSISNQYSKLSKLILVSFIKKNHYDSQLANYILPRKKFKVTFQKVEKSRPLLESAHNDLKKLDNLLTDIEPTHMPIPILIKKYVNQKANVIGFNVDPKFNNSLDGLIILDMNELPENSIENLSR